jgi:hypothetical protein
MKHGDELPLPYILSSLSLCTDDRFPMSRTARATYFGEHTESHVISIRTRKAHQNFKNFIRLHHTQDISSIQYNTRTPVTPHNIFETYTTLRTFRRICSYQDMNIVLFLLQNCIHKIKTRNLLPHITCFLP